MATHSNISDFRFEHSKPFYHHIPQQAQPPSKQNSYVDSGWDSRGPPEHPHRQSKPSSSSASNQGAKATALSKLTPSCSRCRKKKLRCFFTNPDTPSACTNCLSKGLSDECHRDVRIARGKRRTGSNADPLGLEASASKKPDLMTDSSIGKSSMSRQTEIVVLRKRLEELQEMEKGSTGLDKSPKRSASTAADSTPGCSSNYSEGSGTNHIMRAKKRKDVEDAATILEGFAGHGGVRKVADIGTSSSHIPKDTAQEKWQSSSSLTERLQLQKRVRKCPYASDQVVVRELVSVYLHRVNHLAGHVIYGPQLERGVEAFFRMSIEETVTSKDFVDPCCLSILMLVLCLGFEFHPWQLPPGRPATPGFLAVQSIRQRSIDPTEEWYSIALRSLAIEESYHLNSLPALRAACLFLVRGKEKRGWTRMLHQVAISSAQDFGLHRLGKAEATSSMNLDEFVRLESGVRIWNFLSMRDWSLTGDQGHTFIIHPDHSTTRRPLNIADADIESGSKTSKPMAEWTPLSFVITQIELSELIRDSVIVRNRDSATSKEDEDYDDDEDEEQRRQPRSSLSHHHRITFNDKLDAFTRRMPHYFTLDSPVNTPGLIHVQRWLLNQQIFDLKLRLLRSDLTNSESRSSCLLLAENIITHQANIRTICPVIDSLQINFFHLFGACMIIMLDLIEQHQLGKGDRETLFYRDQSRSKVLDALQSFKGNANNNRAIRVLEIMLEYEDDCFSKGVRAGVTGRVAGEDRHPHHHNNNNMMEVDHPMGESSTNNLSTLARRLVDDIQLSSEGRGYLQEKHQLGPALLSKRWSTPSIPDHTLLPIAGAWNTNSLTLEQQSRQSISPVTPIQQVARVSNENNNDVSAKASAFYHPSKLLDSTPSTYRSYLFAQGPVLDWALSLGLDPFEIHHNFSAISHTTPQPPPSPPPHLPSSNVQEYPPGPQQYTHERYLRELDNFNPIRVEKQRQQQVLFGT